MSESISLPGPIRRSRFTSLIVHVSILLLGAAMGAGLAAWVMPERHPVPVLAYDVAIFQSDSPIAEFSTQAHFLSGVLGDSSSNFDGGQQVITLHNKADETSAKSLGEFLYQFITVPNRDSYAGANFQFDIEGKERGQSIVTDFTFHFQDRQSKHHFVMKDDLVQPLVIDKGSKITYALIRVHRITVPPGGSATLPRRRKIKGPGL